MDDQTHLLVTGLYRSGTTFTDRLLDNIPGVSCASQPFPYLYLDVKRRFLESRELPVPRYPIGSGFHDPLHLPDEFREYLATTQLTQSFVRGSFRSMDGYSGALTPALAEVVDDIPAGTLGQVVRSMHTLLARRRAPGAQVVGSKDILIEEFGPALNDAGINLIIVLRDPRAVLASTIGPSATDWSGSPRPLLYSVRLWRKSVAFALGAGADIRVLRYEQLKENPRQALERCLHAFGIDVDVDIPVTLQGADGATWEANTSFPSEKAPRTSFGLTDRQLAFVEALAFPEMLALGYTPVTDITAAERALDEFRREDDPGHAHPVFTPDFSTDPVQLALERERLARLRERDPHDDCQWFVVSGVARLLADAVQQASTGV